MTANNKSQAPSPAATAPVGLVRALRRHRTGALLIGIGLPVIVVLASILATSQYTATASILFRDPGFDQRILGGTTLQNLDPDREAATNVELVSLPTVAEATADESDDNISAEFIEEHVTVRAAGQSDVVDVAATTDDPETAARLANDFAAQFIAQRRAADRAEIDAAAETVRERFEALDEGEQDTREGRALASQLGELTTLSALQTGDAEIVQDAEPPEDPSSPQLIRNAVLALLVGAVLGTSFSLLRSRFDRRLLDLDDVTAAFGMPLLTVVPEGKRLADDQAPSGRTLSSPPPLEFSERQPFEMLRARLRFFNVDRTVKSVLITSARPGDGKSTVSLNLARAAAAGGISTCYVEADLHHEFVGVAGLAEYLTGQIDLDSAIREVESQHAEDAKQRSRPLSVLSAGDRPPNALELLESEKMQELLSILSSRFELVVVDTPPMGVVADALALSCLVDGVLVVCSPVKTTSDDAEYVTDQLQQLGAHSLGLVVNKWRSPRRAASYGYGTYQSQYGSSRAAGSGSS